MTNDSGLEDMISKKEMQKLLNKGKREVEDKYKNILDELKTSDEYQIAKKLMKSGLSPQEIPTLLKSLEQGKPKEGGTYSVGKYHVRVGVIGDRHVGNINYKPELMKYAIKQFDKEKVDLVLDMGDIVDGWYQNRPQSLFEQDEIGMDRQLDKAVKETKNIKQPYLFITGNHEYNTYMRGAGVELGNVFEDRLKKEGVDAHYLGNGEGDIKLKNGTKIKMMHPDGGTAYAISYKTQKLIESFSGGEKPNVLFIGHFHKAEYLFDRNVHAFQTGTLCGQTKFMRGRQIPAHTGFWIVDIFGKAKGGQVDYVVPRFYPAYE